jgi:Orange carotenoid protein, N-terminal/Nuclear transport factor 2 (NTF2) domain
MSYTLERASSIFPDTLFADEIPKVVAAYNLLNAEDQLALLWFAYTEMGTKIIPAAMSSANMIFAEITLTEIKQMPALTQTQVMCDLVNHTDTPICRTYSSFGTNVKLGFWYQLSEWMKLNIVAPIPKGYKLSSKAADVLKSIDALESGQQLNVLQDVVVNMGYAAMGGTPQVKEPIIPPKEAAPRTKVSIKGIKNATVLSYMENMNAFDFPGAVALFVADGALKPPFQEPIVGHQPILDYMHQECYGLKLLPEQGVSEPAEKGFTQIKVTGKVQTPWFGDSVGINLAWRFLLDGENKIFFVGIDLLASPQELVELGLVR